MADKMVCVRCMIGNVSCTVLYFKPLLIAVTKFIEIVIKIEYHS